MAWVFGGKHFGQYTYEHWFDDEYTESKKPAAQAAEDAHFAVELPAQALENESSAADSSNITPGKPQRQP